MGRTISTITQVAIIETEADQRFFIVSQHDVLLNKSPDERRNLGCPGASIGSSVYNISSSLIRFFSRSVRLINDNFLSCRLKTPPPRFLRPMIPQVASTSICGLYCPTRRYLPLTNETLTLCRVLPSTTGQSLLIAIAKKQILSGVRPILNVGRHQVQ